MKTTTSNFESKFNVFFVFLYLLIPFIPLLDTIDEFGPQWFFLSLLNFLICGYLLILSKREDSLITGLVLNKLSIIYSVFVLWSGFSVFYSINRTESYLNLSRLISTFIAFLNISILIYNEKIKLKLISIGVVIILLIQSINNLKLFIDGMYTTKLDTLILSIKENMGNKNVLAANLVLKIPFCIYLLVTLKNYYKVLISIVTFLAVIVIFLLNSRASLVELFIISILFLIYLLKAFFINKSNKNNLYLSIAGFIISVFFAFSVSSILLKNATEYNKNELKKENGYGSITSRVSKINVQSEEGSRIALWKDAIKSIKENPFIGIGIGNWKISSVIYSKERDNDFVVPYHSHNDFLETATETGIIGGLFYLSIFIISGVLLLKIFVKKEVEDSNLISIIALMALITYVLDASLNFPMERPPMQVLFAFVFAIILNVIYHFYKKGDAKNLKETKQFKNFAIKIYATLFLLLSIPTMYYTYAHFQSLKLQKTLYFSDRKNSLSSQELDDIVTDEKPIPNLNYSAIPIDITLAGNFIRLGNYEKALFLLERSKNDNPYLGIYEFNKGIYYFKQNNIDSGFKYFQIAFDKRPRSIDTYKNLLVSSSQKKDTATINKAFKKYIGYRNEVQPWQLYLGVMTQTLGKGTENLVRLADSAIKYFPDSATSLKNLRNYIVASMSNNIVGNKVIVNSNIITGPDANLIVIKINKLKQDGINAFNKKDYKNAADIYIELNKLQPQDYSYLENIGICYYITNDFKNATIYFNKVIAQGIAKDGKSEFYNAISLFQIGQKDAGCNMLSAAKSKNFDSKMIDQYKQIYCK